ncbi:MAG: outer membrane protein assembly factor BamC [Gallionellaceae bacterium]|nr:outer membrane protein assembly factor BamC [Gallionellaceae bacterium]
MRTLRLSALPLAILILSGCSAVGIESKRVDYKSAAVKVPSLEIPPDLTTPGTEDRYTIPGGSGESVVSYSDFDKSGRAKRSALLPEVKSVRLERNGSLHWLVVGEKAESVWPLIKAFWQENGFNIKSENPQGGIMETDWAENRAKIPQGGLRNLIGKAFDSMYSSGEMDMYRTRLERSKDGRSTEVYITHYGKEEVLDKENNTSKWQSRPGDPVLEITMLQTLMSKLDGSAGQDASAESSAPQLRELANGGKVILLSEPFDRSWRDVGLALERAGITVEDKDRANGIYFVHVANTAKEKGWFSRFKHWINEGDGKTYQVTVRENRTGSEVTANDGNGETNEETLRIIDALYQNIQNDMVQAIPDASLSGKVATLDAAPAPGIPAPPRLLEIAGGGKVMLLSDPLDACWRKVGQALERVGIAVDEKNRADGIYFLPAKDAEQKKGALDGLKFWGDSNKPVRPQVTVREGGTGCEVAAHNGSGETNKETQRTIDALYLSMQPRLQETASGGRVIMLSDSIDACWRRVGLALDRAGIAVEWKRREEGIYFMPIRDAERKKDTLGKLSSWLKEGNRTQVTVRDVSAGCEVAASNGGGETDQETQRIIDALYLSIQKDMVQAMPGATLRENAAPNTVPAPNARPAVPDTKTAPDARPAPTRGAIPPRLQEIPGGGRIILLSDPFDACWRKVGLVLERVGIAVEEKNRADGIYFLQTKETEKKKGMLDNLMFWQSDDSKPVRSQVTVRSGTAGCEVAANNGDGGSNPVTEQVIDKLYSNIGK